MREKEVHFPSDEVVEIELEVSSADWDTIRAEGRSVLSPFSGCRDRNFEYTTVEARLRMGGDSLGRVGLRKRGNLGSLSVYKPSLRIELDAYTAEQRRFGSKTLILNNSRQDRSFTHQCMAYAAFRAAGVAAPDCGFARVSVNGEQLGDYVLIEPIKRPFLKRHFGDDSGDLYEGTGADFREDLLIGFDDKENGEGEPSDVLQRVTEVLAQPGDDLPARLGDFIDLPAFMRFWAVETLVAHWDGYAGDTNNFYVYVRPDSGKLAFIPWGTDSAFEYDHRFLPEEGRPQSVYALARLSRMLYELRATREMYREALRTILAEHWDEPALLRGIDRIAGLAGEAEPAALEAQRAFVRARRAQLQPELDGEAPPWSYGERLAARCREDAITDLSGSFEIPWGVLGEIASPPANTLTITLDGEQREYSQVLGSAGYAPADEGGAPSLRLIAPKPDGRTVVVQFYLGERPLAAGELRMHGFESYGFVLDARDRERYDFKGFVGEGAVTLDEVGTTAGAMLRGRFEARFVSLPPQLETILSE